MTTITRGFDAALVHLDPFTLSESFALAESQRLVWRLLADSLGERSSRWADGAGDAMDGVVVWLDASFDLDRPVREDDEVVAEAHLRAIRKPHALGEVTFWVDVTKCARVRLLTTFVKRTARGPDGPSGEIDGIWTAPDAFGEDIEELLERHLRTGRMGAVGTPVLTTPIIRLEDFDAADRTDFKSLVRIARAAEGIAARGRPTRRTTHREAFFHGGVADGETVTTWVAQRAAGPTVATHVRADGTPVFHTVSHTRPVTAPAR